jgi:tetratricopeptide (TPR) repeat protein
VLLPAGMAAAFPFLDGARWRHLLLWGAFNALLVLSVGVYFLFTPINLPESAYVFFQTPTLEKFLFNLAGNDTLTRLELYPDGSTWPWLPAGVAAALSRIRSASDWLVLAVGFATMAWLAWGLRPGLERADRRRAALLLGVAVGPVFLLVFLSLVWRPCIMPRYTLYCSLALYVAFGGFLSRLRRAGLRRACLALLAGVYLVQLSFVLPAVTRTNWGGLMGHLSQFMKRDDAVVLFGMLSPPRHAFLYHARQSGHEENRFKLVSAFTVPMLCEKAGQFFSQKPDAVLWVVYDQAYQWGPNPLLLQCLQRRGYTVNYMEFIAQENLIMYPVRRGSAAIGATSDCGECVRDQGIFDTLLDAPGLAFASPQEREAAQASLAKMLDVAWPADRFTLALTGMFLAWGHDPALGQRFAEASLRMAPDFGWGHFALGFALWRQGDAEGARQAFDRAFAHDPFLALYRPLAAALCETGVSDRTRAEADRLGRMGMDVPEFLYE